MNDLEKTSDVKSTVSSEGGERFVVPLVDVFEDEKGITVLADMPGVPKDDVFVQVNGDTLTLEGKIKSVFPDKLEAIYAELRVPTYRRSFTLSRELDSTKIDAVLTDGLLTVRIPKQAHAQPRRIAVSAA